MPDPLPRGAELENPQPGARPRSQTYAGQRIELVPLDVEAHGEALFRASHGAAVSAELWTYMHYGPFEDQAAMLAWLGSVEGREDPLFLTVVERASQRAVGLVSFLNIQPQMRSLELGHIWYAPDQQRGETNTAAIFLLLSEAFEHCQCRRVEWKCDSLNARSRSAALRLGFRYEGLFRQHLIVKGRNRDTAWFSMLDSEWPRIRSGMQSWLELEPDERPSLSTWIH